MMKLKDVNKPFLSLFKIMPTEGEIEKYVRLQKKTGFPMLNQNHAATGKKLDLEDIRKAEKNPGTLVTPEELNKMANSDKSDSSVSEDETDRTNLDDDKNSVGNASPDPTKTYAPKPNEEEKKEDQPPEEETKDAENKEKNQEKKLKEKEKKKF